MSEQNIVYLTIMAMLLVVSIVLVLTEHYGWAWIPFFLAAYLSFAANEPNTPQEQESPGKPLVYVKGQLNEAVGGGTYPPCKGTNCGCTDGVSHSPECKTEYERVTTSAARIERLEWVLDYLTQDDPMGCPRTSVQDRAMIKWVLSDYAE